MVFSSICHHKFNQKSKQTNMEDQIWRDILLVREKSPLVLNITNYVVMNFTANILLAAGCSPVMAHSKDEVTDMVKIANALVINIGTLSEQWVESMKLALKQANELSKPTVLDPVGSGATSYRTGTVNDLLSIGRFSVIRGNASEIMSIVSAKQKTKGVDSSESSDNAVKAAKIISQKYNSIVCVSGATDYIVSNDKVAKVKNGHPVMTSVTGMGCAATALIGGFIGVIDDKYRATVSAMALMGIAGELSVEKSKGPGSLQVNFIDKLYNISADEFLSKLKVEY
jgi:hydroxyethylthiazole kinase